MRNCFYRLRVLYRVRDFIDIDLRVHLCDSLILSKLSFGDAVFGGCLLARTRRLMQRIQNACARFCFAIPRRSHVTPYLNRHHLLNMDARRTLHMSTLLFGVIEKQEPIYLYEKIGFLRGKVRGAPRLMCPQHKTTAFRGSFRYAATKCWNNLPPPIRSCKSVTSFKRQVKQFLMEKQLLNT